MVKLYTIPVSTQLARIIEMQLEREVSSLVKRPRNLLVAGFVGAGASVLLFLLARIFLARALFVVSVITILVGFVRYKMGKDRALFRKRHLVNVLEAERVQTIQIEGERVMILEQRRPGGSRLGFYYDVGEEETFIVHEEAFFEPEEMPSRVFAVEDLLLCEHPTRKRLVIFTVVTHRTDSLKDWPKIDIGERQLPGETGLLVPMSLEELLEDGADEVLASHVEAGRCRHVFREAEQLRS